MLEVLGKVLFVVAGLASLGCVILAGLVARHAWRQHRRRRATSSATPTVGGQIFTDSPPG